MRVGGGTMPGFISAVWGLVPLETHQLNPAGHLWLYRGGSSCILRFLFIHDSSDLPSPKTCCCILEQICHFEHIYCMWTEYCWLLHCVSLPKPLMFKCRISVLHLVCDNYCLFGWCWNCHMLGLMTDTHRLNLFKFCQHSVVLVFLFSFSFYL